MFKEDLITIAIIIGIIGAIIGTTWAILTFVFPLGSQGNIKVVGIEVLDLSGNPLPNLNWGSLDPGSTNNLQIQIRNNGTIPVTLSMTTENWNPSEAANFMTVTWNYDNRTILSHTIILATFTLNVSSTIHDIPSFQFNIILTATEA